MSEEDVGVRVSDISVDEEGRVVIDNPEVAERLKAAAEKAPTPPRININCVRGCGGTTNAVPNCGCTVLAKLR